MDRVLWVSMTACTVMIVSACGSGGGVNAVHEAKLACREFVPPVGSVGTITTAEMRATLNRVKGASLHAARAAKADARWNALNRAESEMLSLWQYVVSDLAPEIDASGVDAITSEQRTYYAGLQKIYDSAARTARAECAKATA